MRFGVSDTKITIHPLNESFVHVTSEPHILRELYDQFSFYADNYQFMPDFKNKLWDGKIKLFNIYNNTIYRGLVEHIKEYAQRNSYEIDDHCDDASRWNESKAAKFIDLIKAYSKGVELTVEQHQRDAIVHCITNSRCTLVSPTASGKSLIIYYLCLYYRTILEENEKILIIVPTTSLVQQLKADFIDYANSQWNVDNHVHQIYSMQEKETKKKFVISTWQSLYKLPLSYFSKFGAIIGDECHLFKAKSLCSILEKCRRAKYRVGTTGTLTDAKVHRYIIEGLFGKAKQFTTTNELISKGFLSDLKINFVVLKHSEADRKKMKSFKYDQEIDWIVRNEKRNDFALKLAENLPKSTLMLYQFVDKHGAILYNNAQSGRYKLGNVYFVSGKVKADDREEIRIQSEEDEKCLIIASYKTFSTGINIKSLANIIFVSPLKAKITIMQSMGRGLRRTNKKTHCNIYDIVDDITWKSHKNYAFLHFMERLRLFSAEKYFYTLRYINF